MLPILSREQSRELDQHLIAKLGIPSSILMENAGRGASDVIEREFPRAVSSLVVCGLGNNGGDGLVVARRWLTHGKSARVHLAGDPASLSGDARLEWEAYLAIGGQLVDETELDLALATADVIVDALFGTGLSREIVGPNAELIRRINRAARPIVALDLPSGLDADTGRVWGECVRATCTVSFGAPKRGCFTFAGAGYSGPVHCVDIGAPLRLDVLASRVAFGIERERVQQVLAARGRVGHKGQAGHVLVIAGANGTVGAARLAAHAAFRAGAGVVTVATHPEVAAAWGGDAWETMVHGIPDEFGGLLPWVNKADSIVIGPGLGLSPKVRGWLEGVLTTFRGVVVVDADALTLLAQEPQLMAKCVAKLVLTPHPGEAGRLLGSSAAGVEADRFGALTRLCERFDAAVVLKGAPSLVGDRGHTFVAPFGHACLATAGSGDVLAGIIGALAACGLRERAVAVSPESAAASLALEAATTGVWLHATAGEQLGGEYAARGVLARQIADRVPAVCTQLLHAAG